MPLVATYPSAVRHEQGSLRSVPEGGRAKRDAP